MKVRSEKKVKKSLVADHTLQPPFETRELRGGLTIFLKTVFTNPITGKDVTVGSYKFGVYAFFDYDGEPIYVGQTKEKLSTRIRRHLTNQRTDAVAMNVLDPFEVCEIEVWPLPEYEGRSKKDPEVRARLNALEAAVFERALAASEFKAVLNEKKPVSRDKVDELPPSIRQTIVSPDVRELRGHPDTRIARRAETLARLAQVISEREVQPGLRRTLVTQAMRLRSLAERRFEKFSKVPEEKMADDIE
jgi:hypothetical protein